MQAALLRWAIVALVIVAAFGAGVFKGISISEGEQAKRDSKAKDDWITLAKTNAERERRDQKRVADALDAVRASRDQDRRDFEDKLKNAPRGTLLAKSCPQQPFRSATGNESRADGGATGSTPDPAPGDARADDERFTTVAVGLWNDALAAGATAAERAKWLDAANAATGPADIRSALRNLKENAGLLGECRAREALTQAWLCDKKLAACGD